MNTSDLFRIAFHNPAVLYSILTETTYHSPIRRAVEQELVDIISKHPTYVENNISQFKWEVCPCPAMTFETFSAVLDKTTFLTASNAVHQYRFDHVFPWWKHSFGAFTDEQSAAVYRMIDRFANSSLSSEKFILGLLNLLPETDTYNKARDMLGKMFRKTVRTGVRKHTPVKYVLASFAGAKSVAQWDIRGKNFQALNLDNEYVEEIIAETSSRSSLDRDILSVCLSFALRTEDEFLTHWKRASNPTRKMLATMHGKISKSLLEKLLQKYSLNQPILNKLLSHKDMPKEDLMFYVIRGNETAIDILNSLNAVSLKRTPRGM